MSANKPARAAYQCYLHNIYPLELLGMSEPFVVSVVDPVDPASVEHCPAAVRPCPDFDALQSASPDCDCEWKDETCVLAVMGTDCLLLNLLAIEPDLQKNIASLSRCGELNADLGFVV